MKTFGIIGAMPEEIALLKAEMEILETRNAAGCEFFIGRLAGRGAVLARAGVGKVNAAICAQAMLDLMGVDAVISVGVAGGIGAGIGIGDVVIAADLLYHDMDAVAFGYAPGVIPQMDCSIFPADEHLTALAADSAAKILADTDNRAHIGRMATGDIFVADNTAKTRIAAQFAAHCVEMESAAIAHACHLAKTPFAAIRAISDTADNPAQTDFAKFMPIAANRSAKIVLDMLQAQ